MLEGEYLDMANQLKEKFDEIEGKLNSIERLEKEMKKDLITAYGVIRLLDHLIDTNPVPYDNEAVVLVEMLRGLLSDCIDNYILNKE